MSSDDSQGPRSYAFGPEGAPALRRMIAFCAKAKEGNFFWDAPEPIIANLREEIAEIETAQSPEHRAEEIGDAFFTLACLASFYGVDGEDALIRAMEKTLRRWQAIHEMARADGKTLADCTPQETDIYWKRAKNSGI